MRNDRARKKVTNARATLAVNAVRLKNSVTRVRRRNERRGLVVATATSVADALPLGATRSSGSERDDQLRLLVGLDDRRQRVQIGEHQLGAQQ
jgi:hypothetical protein